MKNGIGVIEEIREFPAEQCNKIVDVSHHEYSCTRKIDFSIDNNRINFSCGNSKEQLGVINIKVYLVKVAKMTI